jgi:hypothetical protein
MPGDTPATGARRALHAGRHLRAQLPSYLVQQRAAVVMHRPLPAVLLSLEGPVDGRAARVSAPSQEGSSKGGEGGGG